MVTLGVILGILSVGNCMTLQGQGPELEHPGKQHIAKVPELAGKEWVPIARGRFMRDILFGIHPESPLNRDAWNRSGYLSLLENSRLSAGTRKTETTPTDSNANEKFDILVIPSPISPRKPTLLGLSPRKRIPKHVMTSSASPVAKNKTQKTNANRGPTEKSKSNISTLVGVDHAPVGAPMTPLFLFPVPEQLPLASQIHTRGHSPISSTKTKKTLVTPQPPRSEGRCIIQSVQVPRQAQPNFYFPMPPPMTGPPHTQFQIPFFDFPFYSLPINFPQKPFQYEEVPSLFANPAYASIQNRLPYPPAMLFYSRPIPLDLFAMEDVWSPGHGVTPKTPIEPEIKISYYPGTSPEIKSSKKGIFTVPSLEAEIIVSSEAKEGNETKNSSQTIPTDKEFRSEPPSHSSDSKSVSTVAPDAKSVKEEQLLVDFQEPKTEETPFVPSPQEKSAQVSTLLE